MEDSMPFSYLLFFFFVRASTGEAWKFVEKERLASLSFEIFPPFHGMRWVKATISERVGNERQVKQCALGGIAYSLF